MSGNVLAGLVAIVSKGIFAWKRPGSLEKVNSRIDKVIEKYLPFDLENDGFGIRYSLQPIREVYAETPRCT